LDENSTFEIRDEEIDVEEIMRKIRENIRMRREAGIYPEIEDLNPAPSSVPSHDEDQDGNDKPLNLSPEARRDLDYINSNWDVENKGYFISSHRPVTGRFLVTGRELVHGEVRRYVDPAIWKQKEFNGSVVRLLNEVARSVEQISAKLTGLDDALRMVRSEISQKSDGGEIDRMKSELLGAIEAEVGKSRSEIEMELTRLDSGIDDRIESRVGQLRTEIDSELSRLDSSVEERIDAKIGRVRTEIDERIGAKVAETKSEIDSDLSRLDSAVDERIDSKVAEMKSEIDSELTGLDSKIDEGVRRETNAVVSAMNQDIQNKAWLASILEGRLKDFEDLPLSSDQHSDYEGINYFVFEEAFRGSRETIKERQSAFVRYFEGSKNVLDIGCGRGEFLELLRERGIGGRGIDLNEDMVAYCRSKGFDVERIDAIAYLEGLEDKSLDGVFLDQVVEHLRPDYMVKMLGLCYKKLKYGHFIVVETVNPLSFTSLANFYKDLTHVRPVHPETLRFLLGSAGFRESETKFFSPVPDESRLKSVNLGEGVEEFRRRFIEIYNKNVNMMNGVLYGAQDYAVIGKK
jgi:O-antigen chain-terminating methyltransferase